MPGKYKQTIDNEPETESQERPIRNTNNQTLKQRINTLVLKTLQENTGKERQTMLNHNQESWKVKLFQNTRVVCSVRECQVVIDDIMGVKRTSKQDNKGTADCPQKWPFTDEKVVIGFDCEGINLGVKGQVTLMQIATVAGFTYIFDLITCPQMMENGLRKILESSDVIKVPVNYFQLFSLRN